MHPLWRRRVLGLGVVVAGTLALSLWMTHRTDAPNVVLISIDTLRRDHVTVYGAERNTTPNLAAFATRAIVYEEAIAAHTNTAPSHATMLTGLTPGQHGVTRNAARLRDGIFTLPQILRDAGYRTAAFVSGFTLRAEDTALDRGFDVYDDEGGLTRRAEDTFRRAQRWLTDPAHDKEPTFLFFHLYDPHFPYQAPPRFLRAFASPEKLRHRVGADLARLRTGSGPAPGELEEYALRYDAEILYSDHWVGELLKLLEQQHYMERAIVIVTSDHGETLDERPWYLDHGERVSDEQIRVPLIVRLPGDRHAGTRVRGQIEHADLVPTLLAHLGMQAPPGLYGRTLRFDGGAPAPARPAFSLARSEPKRMLEYDVQLGPGLVAGMREPGSKVVFYPTRDGRVVHLFDLAQDPGERAVLAPPDLEARAAPLDAWLETTGTKLQGSVPALASETREGLRALGYVE